MLKEPVLHNIDRGKTITTTKLKNENNKQRDHENNSQPWREGGGLNLIEKQMELIFLVFIQTHNTFIE